MVHCVHRLQCASKLACSVSHTKMKPEITFYKQRIELCMNVKESTIASAVCDRTHDNIILL